MFLPDDLLRYIGSFCDLDTRRALGLTPGKLVLRDTEVLTTLSRPETTISYVSGNDDEETVTSTRLSLGHRYEIRFHSMSCYFNSVYCQESYLMVRHYGRTVYLKSFLG